MLTLPSTFGKYKVLEEIARGAYGIVYKAHDNELNRIVALKILRDSEIASPQQIERFRREAKLAAKLDHNNIIKIYDAGIIKQEDGRSQCYISMDFVDGTPLSTKIIDRSITPKDTSLLVEKIALALSYAHSEGIIHRDIKPANIILQSDGTPVITDFGIAKRIEATTTLTQTGELLGTPSYMPPEQIAGNIKEIDERSDIYSLGALLYELLTFCPPFEGDNFLELSAKILNDTPAPPTKLNPSIDKNLETICLKAMSKEKRHRYQTAKEMAIDLCRFNEGRDILAKPPGISTKVVTKIKRHKVFTAITSMLIVALTIFLLYRSVFVNPLEKIAEETTATLSITTDPLNVDITIIAPNIATLKGKTPFTDKVKIGYYTLMLKKDGYPYFFMPISVERNIASTVKLRLYREEEIPENMVYIPAGEFPMDNPAHVGDINLGLHKVFVKPFFIDKYEVTNAQYKLFIDATNHKPPQSWKDGKIPKGKELFPVTDVIYNDALSYASWAGKRLPTEEEWEKAARGIDGRIYPWGNKFISKNLNYSAKEQSILSKLRSVGSYPEGVSPYGCYDMAGNAAEWTISQDKWGKFKLRGGSYLDVPEFCTTYTSILLSSSENTSKGIGFRCVKDAPE